jgi:ABC-type dipeptide/oligopeptide/nickel transport system permease subunit
VARAGAGARLLRNRSALAGGITLALLVAFAVLGPILARHGPLESDFARGVGRDLLPAGPSWDFPLGADRIFRDVFARLAVAARLSLAIALSATALATVIGATIGITAGYFEGKAVRMPWAAALGLVGGAVAVSLAHPWVGAALVVLGLLGSWVRPLPTFPVDVDAVLMRAVDVLLAFPFLLLVMGLAAAVERTSAVTIFLVLGATGWLGIARVLRAKTLQVRAQEYVVASQALGQTAPRILLEHVVPNVAGPLVVSSTVLASQMIVADAVLSYLGVGLAPPTPTWGRMLFEGQTYVTAAPWLVLAPASAILLAAWGFNMLGEGLRDALDPR